MCDSIKSFFTKRFEVVVVCGKQSFPKPMISGVPQRSCLGPLLFFAYRYVNDIDNCIYHGKILKYANDIKVYSEIFKANSDVDSPYFNRILITLLNEHRYGNYHSMLINVLLLIFLKTTQQIHTR